MRSSVTVEIVNKTRRYKVNKTAIKTIIKHIATNQKLKEKLKLDIALVSKDKIKELNNQYRGKNKPTNVLSFTLDHIPGKIINGELIICPEKAQEEAKRYGNNFNDYFIFLIVHGVLHILGFDHENEKDRIDMEKIEETLLLELQNKIKRQVIVNCLR